MNEPDPTFPAAEALALAPLALDSLPTPVFWTDARGAVLHANQAARSLLSGAGEGAGGLLIHDVLPEFPSEARPALWDELRAKGTLTFPARVRSPDGAGASLEVTARHVRQGGRDFVAAHACAAAEGADGELRFSRRQLGALLRGAPAAMTLTRLSDGLVLEVNEAFEALFGFRREDLVGRTTLEAGFLSAGDRWRLVDLVRRDGSARLVDLRLRRKDGAAVDTYTSAVALSVAGEPCLLAMVVDLSRQKAVERELREREERLRVIFDASMAAIILVDSRGTITFANRRAAEMFGWPLEELVGSAYPAHLHPDERQAGDDRMRRLIAGELDHVATERRYVRRDGTDFWGYLSGRRHEDAEGSLVSLVGVIADITERKQAEEALRCSQERYRGLIELAADTILQGDPMGRIIGANQSASALTGYAAGELLGMNISRLFSKEERERAPLRYDLLREGKTVRTERVLTRRDGTAVPVEMSSKMMPDGTYQTIIRDVGERRRAEDEVRASEQKFAAAFHHAPVLMTLSSLEDGRYLEVNEKFVEVSGFSRDEAVGRTSVDLGWIGARERERLVGELERNGRVKELELALTAKDGRPVHCLYSGERVAIDGIPRLLSIALDVTETKRLQEEVVKTQRLESLGVLAGGLAHDFNNILTGVLGNLSFARTLLEPGHGAAGRLRECEKAAHRAGELTRQLLTFARGGVPVKATVDVARLVDEALTFALRGTSVKGVADLAPDLWCVDADEGQLSQVFHNLLLNAVQAMPSGGRATVRGRNVAADGQAGGALEPGRYVRLDFEDEGGGIPRALLGKVFDPYFTTKAEGTGLGLTMVHSVVKRHGGGVSVASEPGRGTTLTVHLPAAAEGARAAPPSTEVAPADAPRGAEPGGARVLVMDDEEMIRELAGAMLEALGCMAETCADGAEAVERFRGARAAGEPFDAVILDLTVPGAMGGKEAAARILALDPGAVLIVSSGYSNDPVVAERAAFGFAGAVVKPYSLDRLAGELGRVLHGRRKAP